MPGQIVNQKPRASAVNHERLTPLPPLSADAKRVLKRIPADWSSEREVRAEIHLGLFLQISSIAQILNALERRELIQRGRWENGDRPIRLAPSQRRAISAPEPGMTDRSLS
jgi:hypothetical protein